MEQKKQTFIFSICDSLRKYNLTNEVKIFIACQFALESNFGTSQLARNRNNFCGMKTPLVRISSANNAGKPLEAYASYSSLNDCVDDYMLCIQYHRPMSRSISKACIPIRSRTGKNWPMTACSSTRRCFPGPFSRKSTI